MAAPDPDSGAVELRCESGLHGISLYGGIFIEVKCRHWGCNRGGMVTFHTIDVQSGKVIKTEKYKDPNRSKERK